MNLTALHQNYGQLLSDIEKSKPYLKEALFIKGGKSNYILESDWESILSFMPKARISTVEQAGHWVHAEAPEDLLNLVMEFLAE